jgi:hypothetical protein
MRTAVESVAPSTATHTTARCCAMVIAVVIDRKVRRQTQNTRFGLSLRTRRYPTP